MLKKRFSVRSILLLLFITCISISTACAQLSVSNGSFETFTRPPIGISKEPFAPNNNELRDCGTSWTRATRGSSDYFNKDIGSGNAWIPNNQHTWGLQPYPNTGVGCAGIIAYERLQYRSKLNPDPSNRDSIVHGREYIRGSINTSQNQGLAANAWYNVSFRVARAKHYYNSQDTSADFRKSYAVEELGAYISTDSIGNPDSLTTPILFHPQVYSLPQLSAPVITATEINASRLEIENYDWQLITGRFKATGGEKYITIGNFKPQMLPNGIYMADTTYDLPGQSIPDDNPVSVASNGSFQTHAYYFIDDVQIQQADNRTCGCTDYNFNVVKQEADPVNHPNKCGYKITIIKNNSDACDIVSVVYTINGTTYNNSGTDFITWVPSFRSDTLFSTHEKIRIKTYNIYGEEVCNVERSINCDCACYDYVQHPDKLHFYAESVPGINNLCCFNLFVENKLPCDYRSEDSTQGYAISDIIISGYNIFPIQIEPDTTNGWYEKPVPFNNWGAKLMQFGNRFDFLRAKSGHKTKIAKICFTNSREAVIGDVRFGSKQTNNTLFYCGAPLSHYSEYPILDTLQVSCMDCCPHFSVDTIPFSREDMVLQNQCCKKFRISKDTVSSCNVKEVRIFEGSQQIAVLPNPVFPRDVILCKDDYSMEPFTQIFTMKFYDSTGNILCEKNAPGYNCGHNQTGGGGGPIGVEPGHNKRSPQNDRVIHEIATPGSPELALQVLPNPITNTARIIVNLTFSCKGKLQLINSVGQVITVIKEDTFEPGAHTFNINTEGIASGVYYIRFQSPAGNINHRVVIQHQ